jgi:hypothetical protein
MYSDLKKQEGKAIQDKKTPKKQRKASYRKPSCTSGGDLTIFVSI